MIKSKKQMFIIIGVFTLVLLVGSISYAVFNYQKTLSGGEVLTGDISMNHVEGDGEIELSNAFPETKEEARARDDNYITFDVTGKNESSKTIYYEFILDYGQSKASPKTRYDDKDLRFDLVELDNNGDEVSYLLDNASYSSLASKRVYVDTIDANTSSTVTRHYKLRMWLDGGVIISDTAPNANYTTTEYPNKYATVKVIISGDLVEKAVSGAYTQLAAIADTTTLIDFAYSSGPTNGQGMYVLPGTEDETYPILYYRGDIYDNNVVFGGFCWQIVRTTDTGGIKMIYNGMPDVEGSGANITYNCGTSRLPQNSIISVANLSHSVGYYYADDYEIVGTAGNSIAYRLKQGTNPITQVPITSSNAETNFSTIVSNYPYTCAQTSASATCSNIYKVDSYLSGTKANVYSTEFRTVIGNSVFNSYYTSPSYVGYMYNAVYTFNNVAPTSGVYFGTSVEYGEYDTNNPGTNVYRLVDDGNGSVGTTLDANHHYTCNLTNAVGTCSTIRYYYYNAGVGYGYINLTNGEKIEDALYKMTGNGNAEIKERNSGYNLNVNSSKAKVAIEDWFRTNLTSEIDANNPNYSTYLEDTIYCNDRSFKTIEGNTSFTTYNKTGWNPVAGSFGGNLIKYLNFGTYNRYKNNYYNTANVPSTLCQNETDRFSVSSSVAHLNYPVGLLTADEIIMAGVPGTDTSTSDFYLYTNHCDWNMSPSDIADGRYVEEMIWCNNLFDNTVNQLFGLRPVVSLKPGIKFESGGDGTPTNPYVVKYD